jgi:hypothetical protein
MASIGSKPRPSPDSPSVENSPKVFARFVFPSVLRVERAASHSSSVWDGGGYEEAIAFSVHWGPDTDLGFSDFRFRDSVKRYSLACGYLCPRYLASGDTF